MLVGGAEAIQHWVLIYVLLAFRLQPANGSNIAALVATLLSPALPLSGPISRSDPIPWSRPVPGFGDPAARVVILHNGIEVAAGRGQAFGMGATVRSLSVGAAAEPTVNTATSTSAQITILPMTQPLTARRAKK